MVFPDFLRKIRTSKEDNEDEKKEKHSKPYRRVTLSTKCIVLIGVILLVLAALTINAVVAFDHGGSHGTEKSIACDSDLQTYVHKGEIVMEKGSQIAKIQCEYGNKLIGSPAIECLPSGNWNETPTCVPKECKNFLPPAHAHLKLESVDSSILKGFKVSCDDGYLLEGNQTVVCQSDETWSQTPQCKPVDCGDPPRISKGETKFLGETTYNNSFLVECNDGYHLGDRNGTVKCAANGKWGQIPECAPVSCGLPNKPNHANIQHIEGTVFRKSVLFECTEGYEMQGDPAITCQSKGNWSSFPVCKLVDCGYPSHISNGRIKNLKYSTYNSDFDVECNDGYVLKGNEKVTCESTGKWVAIPVCEPVSCGPPEMPYDAYIISQGGNVFQGSVTFTCKAGYQMKDNPTVTCQRNGKWTEYPRCEYINDPCYSNPCQYGCCVATGNTYECKNAHSSGYTGIFCETACKKFSLLLVSLLMIHSLVNF